MSRMMNVLAVGATCSTITMAAAMITQDPAQPPMSAEEQAMMEAYEKYAAPGEHHEKLAKLVGEWDVTVEHWMAPDAPAEVSTGHTKCEMLMGGRYLAEHFSGETPWGPFEGVGITGYDNIKQKYVAVWIDSMSTGILASEGEMTDGAIVYEGDSPDPVANRYTTARSVERMVSENKRIIEMYQPQEDGSEFMTVRITYTRQSEGGMR